MSVPSDLPVMRIGSRSVPLNVADEAMRSDASGAT